MIPLNEQAKIVSCMLEGYAAALLKEHNHGDETVTTLKLARQVGKRSNRALEFFERITALELLRSQRELNLTILENHCEPDSGNK